MPTNCQVYATTDKRTRMLLFFMKLSEMTKVDSQTNLCTLLKLLELQFRFSIKHVRSGAFCIIRSILFHFATMLLFQLSVRPAQLETLMCIVYISNLKPCIVDVT